LWAISVIGALGKGGAPDEVVGECSRERLTRMNDRFVERVERAFLLGPRRAERRSISGPLALARVVARCGSTRAIFKRSGIWRTTDPQTRATSRPSGKVERRRLRRARRQFVVVRDDLRFEWGETPRRHPILNRTAPPSGRNSSSKNANPDIISSPNPWKWMLGGIFPLASRWRL